MIKREKKSFVYNTLYNIVYRMINIIFPFIISVYASNVLKAEGIGLIATVQNFVSYFTFLAALGIPNYGIKEIAKYKDNPDMAAKSFNELIVLNAFSTTVCLIAYYFICNLLKRTFIYELAGISIMFNYFNVDWYYYGREMYKYITIRCLIVRILTLGVLFFTVKTEKDYINYFIVLSLYTGINNLINMFNIMKSAKKIHVGSINMKVHLKSVVVLFATSVSIELYTLFDTTMISMYCDSKSVGYYTTANKFVKIIIVFLVAVGGALLPRLVTFYQNKMISECNYLINKVFSILFFLAIPCGIGVYSLADSIIPLLYGESFVESIITVKIFSFLFYFLTFSNLFGTQILLAVGEEKKLLFSTSLGMFSNVFLNLILIPVLMHNGAAAASVISEMIVTFSTGHFAKKYFDIHLNRKFLCSVIISSMVMYACLHIIHVYIDVLWIRAFVMVLCGSIIYLGMNLLMKNEIVMYLFPHERSGM